VAAIEPEARTADAAPPATARTASFGTVVMAALAVQGAMPLAAQAETAPEHGLLSLRYLHYQDQQKVQVQYPGYDGSEPKKLKRITAKSPSIHVLAPIGTQWTLEASAVSDDVSGATPKYYTDVSGATPAPGMKDKRKAGDIKVSRHFSRAGVSVGASHSTEYDYKSTAFSIDTRLSTADNNTTFNLGFGRASDKIDPVNKAVSNERKRSNEIIAGVTQALTPQDLVQLNASHADGRGYFTDPYKRNDKRPDRRKQSAALVRWNHHFSGLGTTLRSSYRYYRDSFGIAAHTAEAAWVQPFGRSFSLTPSLRYHTQSSADFYYDPVMDASIYPRPLVPQTYTSADQRLSAFGAVTAGLKAEFRFDDWTTDLKYEHYEQRSDWRAFGKGSPNLDVFSADSIQLGVSRKF
jgi:hypothetical protein